jgi:dTDP-4-dehydrorhamnose reductase
MKILIIGASGLVGGNCMKFFKQKGFEVLGTHFSFETDETVFFDTLDIFNAKNKAIHDFKADVILNCGALTFVDYCEDHQEESFRLTCESNKAVLDYANTINAKYIYVSTDYIFDGKNGPYLEDDAPNPISVYGKHKFQAEQYITEKSKNDYIIIRITNVYGDEIRNKNFVSRIVERAENKQKITLKLPIDQYATPVNAADIARALYLLIKDNQKGVYHISSTDYLNRCQLAERILSYFDGVEVERDYVFTKNLNQAADRPLQGGLKNLKFMSLYPDFNFSSLDNYLISKTKYN